MNKRSKHVILFSCLYMFSLVHAQQVDSLLNAYDGSVTGLDYTLLPGYTPLKQFYSSKPRRKADEFFTGGSQAYLVPHPNIFTDGVNKKVTISFYNNDISHSVILVLEGMAARKIDTCK